MNSGRRETSNDRRRRLLVYRSGHQGEAGGAAEQRQLAQVREARRPATNYSGNVRRQLRGRWFSLVPVRRRSLLLVGAAAVSVALLLCAAHWAAVLWPALAARPELSRPLRLDRPDSFGSWIRAAFFASSAVLSLMIYQLRRYRNDDYRGSYRLWPPVILLMLVASVDSVCRLVPWIGAMLEWSTGDATLMAGSDWVRIVLTVGGMALALRMIAEVWRSPVAMPLMTLAIVCLALPTAARWGVVSSGTRFRWLVFTSAPVIGAAALWLSCVAYLRMVFREVRQLDQDTIARRVRRWREQSEQFKQQRREERQALRDQHLAAKAAAKAQQVAEKEAALTKRQAEKDAAAQKREEEVAQRAADKAQQAADRVAAKENKAAEKAAAREARNADAPSREPRHATPNSQPAANVTAPGPRDAADGDETTAKPPRHWQFWKRKPKVDEPANEAPAGRAAAPTDRTAGAASVADAGDSSQPRRSWRFWKRKPKDGDAVETSADTRQRATAAAADAAAGSDGDTPTERKGRLGGWLAKLKLKRKPVAEGENGPGDGEIGEDGVDWSSLDKHERRRMRREMKRGGNAA